MLFQQFGYKPTRKIELSSLRSLFHLTFSWARWQWLTWIFSHGRRDFFSSITKKHLSYSAKISRRSKTWSIVHHVGGIERGTTLEMSWRAPQDVCPLMRPQTKLTKTWLLISVFGNSEEADKHTLSEFTDNNALAFCCFLKSIGGYLHNAKGITLKHGYPAAISTVFSSVFL